MSKQKKIVSVQRVNKRLVKTTTHRDMTVEEEAEESANATAMAREEAQDRVRAHLLSLIAQDFPTAACSSGLSTLRVMSTALPGQSGSQELRRAIARDEYAQAKMSEIDSADQNTASTYDPAADTGWP